MSQDSAANPVTRRNRSPRHSPSSSSPAPPLPSIPDKLYFRIGEVARLCQVQTSVLRFWETEFPQLHPGKGSSGQRLFRRRDVETALRIRHLLYTEGYTIPGARQLLRSTPHHPTPLDPELRSGQLSLPVDPTPPSPEPPPGLSLSSRLQTLQHSLRDLHALVSRIPAAPRRSRPAPAASLFDPPAPAVH